MFMLIICMEVIIKREGRIVVKEVFGFRGMDSKVDNVGNSTQ
jgi:hypothetical protein